MVQRLSSAAELALAERTDDLVARLVRLSPEQRVTVAAKLGGRRLAGATESDPRNALLASHAQQQMWVLWRLAPQSPAYNVPMAWRLRGPLDVASWRQAVGAVVARHEALRTRFAERAGHLHAVVEPDTGLVDLPVREIADASRLDAAVSAACRIPFDLAGKPPLRVRLLKLGRQDHVLIFVVHHIACDGWSMGLLWNDVVTLYKVSLGIEAKLEPVTQYSAFADYEQMLERDGTFDRDLAYWRRQLARVRATALPGDNPRPEVPASSCRPVFREPKDVALQVRRIARANGVTPFVVTLSAFVVLLHSLTGESDIAIGSVISRRAQHEFANAIGCFTNTVVLRFSLTEQLSFCQLLRDAHRTVADAAAHSALPFDRVVQDLRVPRSTARNPLFQVMFLAEGRPGSAQVCVPGLEISAVQLMGSSSHFDLTLGVAASNVGLEGELSYNCNIYSDTWAARLLRHYTATISVVLSAPGESVSSVARHIMNSNGGT